MTRFAICIVLISVDVWLVVVDDGLLIFPCLKCVVVKRKLFVSCWGVSRDTPFLREFGSVPYSSPIVVSEVRRPTVYLEIVHVYGSRKFA